MVSDKRRLSMTKKIQLNKKLLAIGVASMLIIGGIIALIASGYVAVSWGDGKRPLSNRTCDDDIVARYNDASLYDQRDDSGDYAIDEASVKNIVAEVKKKSGYQDDPTCQTIVLMTAIDNKDYDVAKSTYIALQSLHDQQLYADSNLRTGSPLSNYETYVNELAPVGQNSGEEEPQGGR